ncbi:MAG: hypothetical protein B6D61_06485 [Bacteroidetes bacterium 4484_249]|jgi:hypothetical protein|nr:MAG: hypothetical protein B6D61_06485 [Bacteroidetes bacterium 4484_249]
MNRTEKITNLQQELLKVFSYNLSEKQLLEIKELLSNYFAEKATNEMDELWEKNKWNNQTMEDWSNEHLRTPYLNK